MTLSDRQEVVLEAVIREYITNAAPVSSQAIAHKNIVRISPATVRAVMTELEEQGYLTQPHTSAGRMPTQQGYRYFVDNCIEEEDVSHSIENRLDTLEDIRDILRYLTARTHVFSAVVEHSSGRFAHYGVEEVLQYPEFADSHRLRMFARFVDMAGVSAKRYRSLLDDYAAPSVFIEQENPVAEARCLSVVISPLGEEHMFFAVGPARMQYDKVLSAARSLSTKQNWEL
jgi:transcriptional regulator of heat shock response